MLFFPEMAELFEQMLELTPMTLAGFRASLWNALICSPFAAGPYDLPSTRLGDPWTCSEFGEERRVFHSLMMLAIDANHLVGLQVTKLMLVGRRARCEAL